MRGADDIGEDRWHGWRIAGWVFLIGLLLWLSLRQFDSFQLGTYEDDARYAVLARAIARGEPYGLHLGPGPPFTTGYPFGFPLLLSPLMVLWPDSLERLKVVSLAAALVNVSLLYWGWPRLCHGRGRAWGAAIAGLYAVSPVTVTYTRLTMSEGVFTSWLLLSLLLAERCGRGERSLRAWWFVGLGISLTAALFTRSIGVMLCGATLLWLAPMWWRSPLRVLGAMAAGMITVVAPVSLLNSVALPNLVPWRYLEVLEQPSVKVATDPSEDAIATRVTRGVAAYAQQHVRSAIVPIGGGDSERALGRRFGISNSPVVSGLVVSALVLIGAAVAPRFGQGLRGNVLLFEVLYLASIQLWFYRDARLVMPLQAFLTYQLLWGIGAVAAAALGIIPRRRQRGAGRVTRRGAACAATGLFVAFLLKASGGSARESWHFARDFRVGTSWIKEHAARDAVVMTQAETAVHLYADRPVVSYPHDTSTEADLRNAVRRLGVDYLLIAPAVEWREGQPPRYDDFTQATILPLLAAASARGGLSLVYESAPDLVRVYRVEAPWRAGAR